jgi:hypothetical protein
MNACFDALTTSDQSRPPMATLRPHMEHDYKATEMQEHDPSKDITGALDRTQLNKKTKVKTKGLSVETEVDIAVAVDGAIADPEVIFDVAQENHRVFRTLFHMPEDGEPLIQSNGPIFSALSLHLTLRSRSCKDRLDNSWQFTPPATMSSQQAIQFHEPHPNRFYSKQVARNIGCRLEINYGWTGSMFRSR